VLLPPGGGPPRALTSGPADLEPVWSPDGRWIAYTALAPDGGRAIATLPADGSGEPRLIARGKEPTFTPDGAWVVYSGLSRGRWRLWQVRPEGMGRHPLGEGTFDEHDPSVAPDGRYVAFVVQQGDSVRQSLYVRRFEGGAGRPLLDYEEGASPTW
jgi:TolB protein